ncbi:neuroglian-like isoform X1 [Mercenaria mercenaria]|uniref:neuroglian-like isoform X1 n=1 Tax=Mercenaria mercenaria TaxID=6596 RepID=UPI001E1DD35B|nr:neuroglian-like isoform X1 [Mercenaria mercenaria]XP_053377612.1 neuroglian-like isoform X1 [Mercenaria mercenaria]
MKPPQVFGTLSVFWILHSVNGDILISKPLPKSIIADQGKDVRISCGVKVPEHLNEEKMRIRWKHNGHYIHDKDHSDKYTIEDGEQTLLISNVEGSNAGVYSCVVIIDHARDLASGKLIVREPPDAPREVSIISCSGNQVELIWKKGEDGGAEITHYLVQFNTSESPDNWMYYYDEIPGEVETTYMNLSPWGTYSFRLLAKNDVGFSKPSEPTKQQCTTPPERPGGNPKDVRTLTHKMGKLIVTWTPMARLLHNGPGFKYAIFWRRKGSTYWNKNIVENSNAKMWEVSVNDTYTLYEIKVKAMNQIGDSRQPAFIYLGYSGEGEPTVIPKDFRLDRTKQVEAHKAHFIWEAVDTAEGKIQGEFRGYKLRYWKSSEGRHKWKEVDILITKADHGRLNVRAAIDDLPAYTALRAQVSVMNTHYTGPPSQTIDFTTPEGVPDPVRDLRIEAHGTTYALLKWLPPEEPNGLLLGYDIGYQQINEEVKGPKRQLRPQIDSPDTLGARITGLSSNHDYRFYVYARTKMGRGEESYIDVKTKDGEPPDTPQPKFMTLDQTSVNITWTPYRLIDVSYVLEYRLAGQAHWSVANSEWGRSWMVINDLMPDMEYEVRLKAKNKYGDTASSTLYRVKTQPRQGRDAHLYQQDEPPNSGSAFSGASTLYKSLSSYITRTTMLQTSLYLVIVNLLLH